MDSILKYNRIQGKLIDLLQSDKITATIVGENSLIIGTLEGLIHVASFTGLAVQSYSLHDRQINDLSLDNFGQILLSCSDSGKVVIQSLASQDEKETVIHMSEPLKSICIEDDTSTKRERSFVVGTASGQLIHHRQVWFTQKNIVLFSGAGSPVTKISWRGNIVAWADATQVRLMDITTQTAICYLNCPDGVGLQNPYPCHLFWETEMDLLVGWADSFRHVQLYIVPPTTNSAMSLDSSSAGPDIRANTAADWQADSIICGIASLDVDHVLLLGYIPPEPEGGHETSPSASSSPPYEINKNLTTEFPELQIVVRATGVLVAADALPLRDFTSDLLLDAIGAGPWGYRLVSDHSCYARRENHTRWSLQQVLQGKVRGGLRGLAPTVFILSSTDIVICRVKNIDDRISQALETGDLKAAVTLAMNDSLSLRQYKLEELTAAYIQALLDEDQAEEAAMECSRLLKSDPVQWERWIYAFALKRQLSYLIAYIPTGNPRLPQEVYEMVLDHFLANNSKAFLDIVQRWGRLRPPPFDMSQLLSRLENRSRALAAVNTAAGSGSTAPGPAGSSSSSSSRSIYSSGGAGQTGGAAGSAAGHSVALPLDPWCLEALAQLYIFSKQYEKALNCYLAIQGLLPSKVVPVDITGKILPSTSADPTSSSMTSVAESRDFQHVFELIEKEVRLSQSLAGPLLIRRVDFFTVQSVVSQLKEDRKLLLWYLHMLFCELPEKYNSSEYAEYHLIQVSLYVEFNNKTMSAATPLPLPITRAPATSAAVATMGLDHSAPLISTQRSSTPDSELLTFLKSSSFIPLELAWKECSKVRPPLFREMVFILIKMRSYKEALNIILRELQDVQEALHFVETVDSSLWMDVVAYSKENPVFMAKLLDVIGTSNVNTSALIAKIPSDSAIPDLKMRMLRVLQKSEFQAFLYERCGAVMNKDTLGLLQALNSGQKRPTKVDPNQSRCGICGRPLAMTPGSVPPTALSAASSANTTASAASSANTTASAASSSSSSSSSSITQSLSVALLEESSVSLALSSLSSSSRMSMNYPNNTTSSLAKPPAITPQIWGPQRSPTYRGGLFMPLSKTSSSHGSHTLHSPGIEIVVFSSRHIFHRICYEEAVTPVKDL